MGGGFFVNLKPYSTLSEADFAPKLPLKSTKMEFPYGLLVEAGGVEPPSLVKRIRDLYMLSRELLILVTYFPTGRHPDLSA